MRILMICPSLQIRSEWLFTLINNLKEDIAYVATNEINLERIDLPQQNLNPLYSKIIRRIDEGLNQKYIYTAILNGLEQNFNTTINYVHFLSFAVNFKNFIFNSTSPTLIHCHGKDIMWDLKKIESGEDYHSDAYFRDVKELAKHAFFIANSNFTRNQLLKMGIEKSKIFINHFGIELKEKSKNPTDNIFRILYLGRLVDFKGPLETIDAFEKSCDLGLKGELIIAGGGELEDKCKEKIEKSKYRSNIQMLGWVDKAQAQSLYNKCDIFTAHNKIDSYTNQVEAFGVTIIEAMSYGLPVVTGRSGGVSDSVVNGETGYLIEPGNIDTHAKTFLDLYRNKDLRDRLSKNSRARIKNYFCLQKEKEGLQNIINQTIQNY
ncbi:glycosyltransferase involved in cell wall biosynthesis [Salegentibacter sp. 24]|uniref:glycosyltransferase family 4 protein n=1 Tax=Salegentibacter sp. 24 TaxID=2183986 RepID=UPI00105DF811|nr:glycosyltransferase family 4 protein [Salegentibacter sp. 24]TDN82183.1 glycosyltransferase involved in cell wall biosynthesis [Salegentibacter sp. 24]